MLRPWLAGARPKTLPAALVPVAVGTALAVPHASAWRAGCALVVSLALQVGVNYANDYSDGIRGADADRVGPTRLVASKAASPQAVKRAALLSFVIAGVAGLPLAAVAGWWLVGVGAAAMVAAWAYTGGPRPYGYGGLGELFVFVFFGLVAVLGTVFVQAESISAQDLVASVPVGLVAVALLVVNNLRDIDGDRAVGKRTLAVRMGDRNSRLLYATCVIAPLALAALLALWRPWAVIAAAAGVAALGPLRLVIGGAKGRELLPALAQTGYYQLLFGALFTLGLWIGA